MIKNILVPLDGSDFAEGVIPYVRAIVSRTKAQVLLFSAVPPVAVWDAASSMIKWDREEEFAREYIDGQLATLRDAGVTARGEVRMGDPGEGILKLAAEQQADLIAMSTHGRSGITRWLFGSLARHVLEAGKVPVLMVHPHEGTAVSGGINKILVPLDASSVAEGVLPVVEEFAKAFGASIVLFNAIAPLTTYPGFETVYPAVAGDVLQDLQKQADSYLAGVASAMKERGLNVTAITTIDTAAAGILEAAKQSGADLIAIGTHGRSGIGRAVLGSVADAVIRRSHLPCLAIHPASG